MYVCSGGIAGLHALVKIKMPLRPSRPQTHTASHLQPQVIAEFLKLKKEHERVIADICKKMGAGMAQFIDKKVSTIEDYNLVRGRAVALELCTQSSQAVSSSYPLAYSTATTSPVLWESAWRSSSRQVAWRVPRSAATLAWQTGELGGAS